MGRLDVVQWGSDRLRVGPWRGDATVAQVVPPPGQLPSRETIDRCLAELEDRGYRTALTSALTYGEQQPFLDAGFAVHERLHLLRHDLRGIPARPPRIERPLRLRRGRRSDRTAVLAVDGAAFSPFWRFDGRGLDDARAATPNSRFRVADDGEVVGYAVTGRAGTIGYLQRLAVLPHKQRRGIGRALVLDALVWVQRRGATSLLVNTQETNTAALELYERTGFEREAYGLAVLEHPLAGDTGRSAHRVDRPIP
jgi:ribosomal protein S18 acetylase RimI-like enzyme